MPFSCYKRISLRSTTPSSCPLRNSSVKLEFDAAGNALFEYLLGPGGVLREVVQLELDDTDKKQFAELQQAMGQAQQEQSLVVQKLRVRETEKRRSDLTLSELKDVDNATKAYVQVGKMFLQEDLAGLKKKLSDKSEACGKEAATLKQQKEHVDEAAKKVTADFQEFIKAHLVQAPTEQPSGS